MIGAVVVLFNPLKEEIRNINSYKELVEHMVIIDNSSVDNRSLVDEIVSTSSSIAYYSEQKNLGLAKGFNIGIDILSDKGCKWALLFDADSKMGSNIVSVYKKAIEKYSDRNVAVFAPVHVFERSKNKPYQGYRGINWSMTSGCLYNCKIFKLQGGFFEELFVDGLDMDYCFKAHENGYEIIECGEAFINHNPAESKCFMGFKYGIASPYRYYMQARQLIWCWRRYRNSDMLFTYGYKWFKVIFLFPNKQEYIRSMIKGTKAGRALLRSYCLNDK